MRAYLVATMIAAAPFMVCGCGIEPIEENELVGEYKAELPDGGTELLNLLRDGKCVQVIQLKSGATYEAHGSWKYDQSRGRILLKGIRQSVAMGKINPQISQSPSSITIGTRVSRTPTGTVIIYLTEDTYYRKK